MNQFQEIRLKVLGMTSNERKIAWFASISHFFTHGYMTLLPAVFVVLAGDQSLGFFALGAIVNIGYFLFGFGSIPSGILSDEIGPKRMLTIGLFGMATSSILVGLSPNSVAFAISYALLGLSASIYHPSGLSLIAKHIKKKGKALGLHGVMGNIGLSLAPFFAGLMVMLFDTWRAPYLSFGLIGLIFTVILHSRRIEGEEETSFKKIFSLIAHKTVKPLFGSSGIVSRRERKEKGEDRLQTETASIPVALLLLYTGSVLFGFIYRGSLTFFPALFQEGVQFVESSKEPVALAGLVTTLVLSTGMIGQWFGGYLSDKFRKPEIGHVIIYLIIIPAVYLVSRMTDSWLIALSAVFSIVFYGWQPLQNALIAKYTTKQSHGKGYGMNFFLIMGIGSIATAVGGYIADNQGVDKVYLLLAGMSLIALLISLTIMKYMRYAIRVSFAIEKGKTY